MNARQKFDAQELITKLKWTYRLEAIADYAGKSSQTIYFWSKGTKSPDKANFALLQKMLDEAPKKEA
jgi:hypothetical protein